MGLMSQADYARHRNVSRQAISKAVKAGRIKLQESGGKTGIDPAEADLALGLNVQRVRVDEAGADDERGQPRTAPPPGLTSAKTFEAVYNGRMAQLKYEKEVGRLRPVEQTEIGAARCGEAILRAIETLPARADDITAQINKEGVTGARNALRAVVRELREVIAREFAKLAAGEVTEESELEN